MIVTSINCCPLDIKRSAILVHLIIFWPILLNMSAVCSLAVHNVTIPNEEDTTNLVNQTHTSTSTAHAKLQEIEILRNKCNVADRDLDRCSAELISLGQNSAQSLASKDELDSIYCPRFKRAVDCIKRMSKCYRPFERQIINWILTSTRRMNHKRCKNDNEKQRFLKLTQSCLAPMKDPTEVCMSNYVASLEDIADSSEFVERLSEDDIQIQLSCCANRRFKQCVMSKAKRQCKPVDEMQKLRRANSNSSRRVAEMSFQRAMAGMLEDLGSTLNGMALTGPELICEGVDEMFCRTNFDGKYAGRTPRHKSIVPAMIKIYSSR